MEILAEGIELHTLKCRHGRPIDCTCKECDKEEAEKQKRLEAEGYTYNIVEQIAGMPLPRGK